ncbi:MAG: uroporphyrinogen-III C-methyltransferase [Chloroflexi bacterium]|nr:uroporphyrinogen-III C-methyltransferase [Chloroflexota bacterium]
MNRASAEASGSVSLVGAGPGDPGLITVAGRERLRRADVVVYDRLAHPALLAEAPAAAERIYVGKAPSEHAVAQDEIGRLLVDRARAGKRVVRLKGGDPFVFGRGGEEADDLVAAGVDFDVVPGITSAVAVPAYAGIPITHRDAASSFAVVTGHEAPGKPASRIDWAALATGVDTLVFLMGRRALAGIAARLIAEGRDPATPAAAIEWGATPRQRTVAAPLAELAAAAEAAALVPPAVIVVGQVAALRDRLRWYDGRPLFGKRVLVTRTRAQASTLSRALREAGAEPIEFPAIEIVPCDPAPAVAAAGRLSDGRYDWAVFTSANGVAAFRRALEAAGLDARAFGGVRLAAIGPATAEALDALGLRADVVPDRFVAEALADALEPRIAAGERVLLPRAAGSRDVLPSRLRAAGAEVEDLPVYESRRPAEPDPAVVARIEAGEIDIATFTASSTVRGCLDLLGGRAELLREVTIACIGPITARTATEAGLRVDVVAREHTIPGLMAALLEHAGRETDHDYAHASAHA